MAQTPAAKARSRNLTAAKRSLALIEEAVARHRAAVNAGEIPDDDSLGVSVAKYDQARRAIMLIDSLDAEAAEANGTVEVRPDDLAVLVDVVREFQLVPATPDPDSAFARLAAVIVPPASAEPDGSAPAETPAS